MLVHLKQVLCGLPSLNTESVENAAVGQMNKVRSCLVPVEVTVCALNSSTTWIQDYKEFPTVILNT
jgi:hypothetical protein